MFIYFNKLLGLIIYSSSSFSSSISYNIIDNMYINNDILEFQLPKISYINQLCFNLLKDSSQSCIPSIISPGVQKSGTSFLYSSLINHPKIEESSIKEVNYYLSEKEFQYNSGISNYSSHFSNNSSNIIVDFSPKYMMVSESAELIYKTNRHTKFIIILRDPIDRAYSHYRFQQKLYYSKRHISTTLNGLCPRRKESIIFKQYITEEYKMLKRCGMLHWNPPKPPWYDNITMPDNCITWTCKSCPTCFPLSDVHVTQNLAIGYLSHGIYISHLKHYFKYFPKENFYIVRFEDLHDKGETNILNEICNWLGISSLTNIEWGNLDIKNENSYEPMNKDEEEYLSQFFSKPNKMLESLLEREFNWK